MKINFLNVGKPVSYVVLPIFEFLLNYGWQIFLIIGIATLIFVLRWRS